MNSPDRQSAALTHPRRAILGLGALAIESVACAGPKPPMSIGSPVAGQECSSPTSAAGNLAFNRSREYGFILVGMKNRPGQIYPQEGPVRIDDSNDKRWHMDILNLGASPTEDIGAEFWLRWVVTDEAGRERFFKSYSDQSDRNRWIRLDSGIITPDPAYKMTVSSKEVTVVKGSPRG